MSLVLHLSLLLVSLLGLLVFALVDGAKYPAIKVFAVMLALLGAYGALVVRK